MASGWDIDTYRMRARQWREQAATSRTGEERDSYLVIADGYAHLVALIENDIHFADAHSRRAPWVMD